MARMNVKIMFKTLKFATYSDCSLEPVAICHTTYEQTFT
jgi:hypothetical protein